MENITSWHLGTLKGEGWDFGTSLVRLVNIFFCVSSDDSTQIGHILGRAKLRTSTPAPERNLQPPAICILRAIMHSAFLMCSCHNSDALPELAKLVKPAVNPQQLPEFFWMHLRKDIEHLSRVTGEGMEESAIIVHLVLQDMLSTNGKTPLGSKIQWWFLNALLTHNYVHAR